LGRNLQIVRGLRVLRILRVAVLVVTLIDSPEVAEIALRTGARAVITKSDPPEELLQAVGEVSNQRRYVTRMFRTKLGATLSLLLYSSDACSDSDLTSDAIGRVMERAEMRVKAEFLAICRQFQLRANQNDFAGGRSKQHHDSYFIA
jgi:DNA-binding NarL/FixJ family response regulator